MYPVLIFDLDGTLTDPREGITRSLVHALRAIGAEVPSEAELEQCIGPPLREAFHTLLGSSRDVETAVTFFRQRYGTVGLYENYVYPRVVETLEEIGPSRTMFIATTKPREHAQSIVEHFGLSRFFRRVYGSEMNGVRSDKSELVAHLIASEGLDPASAVVIGDRKYDVLAARDNGLRSIGVGWGFGSEEELTGSGVDIFCRTMDDLLGLLAPVGQARG